MIVLDTNVVSELMRSTPHASVDAWVRGLAGDDLFTTSITVAEITFGLVRLPHGRRRTELRATWDEVLATFNDRVLDFDAVAAVAYADIAASREARGRPIHIADAQIAALCRRDGATLATRNVKDFDGIGLTIVDPFS